MKRRKNLLQNGNKSHILVCLSSSPSNEKIIETASKMAKAYGGPFTALYVEAPSGNGLDDRSLRRLKSNMAYASELGAVLQKVEGDDIAYMIAEYARINGVTDIIIGNTIGTPFSLFPKKTICDQLVDYAGDIDIHIIPDGSIKASSRIRDEYTKRHDARLSISDILKCFLCIFFATILGYVFNHLGYSGPNIIMLYILSVLISAIVTEEQGYSLVTSFVSVIVFNFFFTDPKFTLLAYDKDYPFTFLVMFLVAFITSSLAAKQKQNAKQASELAYRTKLLFDTSQLLQKAGNRDDIILISMRQLEKLLEKQVIWKTDPDSEDIISLSSDTKDHTVLEENVETDFDQNQEIMYYPVETLNNRYGYIGIILEPGELPDFDSTMLTSMLGECALAIENEAVYREKEEAAVLAKNEMLRANLLRGISHDLRTPLTSISGNASILMQEEETFDFETRQKIYADIYGDSIWLINLVENILSITKMEDGRMELHMQAELLSEVIQEAINRIGQRKEAHTIQMELDDEWLMARMDARLILQLLVNLIDNALKYTQEDSRIVIGASYDNMKDQIIMRVEDNGPGIPEEEIRHVFEMFYSGGHNLADSRRSMGLGLYLCKSIVNAHHGKLWAEPVSPHGVAFCFSLTPEKLTIDEANAYE